MLFTDVILEQIRAGRVTCAYRCWRRPSVRTGTRLRTAIGVIEIEECRPIDPVAISDADACAAGAADAASLRRTLAEQPYGGSTCYRIGLRLVGPDPRLALRQRSRMTTADRELLARRLARLDASSRTGDWTNRLLTLIAARPAVPARALAKRLGWDSKRLKRRVRRLKDLGLTESLLPGYRCSPRGRSWLHAL